MVYRTVGSLLPRIHRGMMAFEANSFDDPGRHGSRGQHGGSTILCDVNHTQAHQPLPGDWVNAGQSSHAFPDILVISEP